MENLSVRHASKKFNEENNEHVYRTILVLETEMYNALQEIDVPVLQLSHIEGDAASRKPFSSKMDAIAAEASALTPLMDKIHMWQDSDNTIDIARTK
jgi:hypothetical protein